jgi:hypothetical protein
VDQVTRCRHCQKTPVPISGWLCAACQVEEEGATSEQRAEFEELYMWIILGAWALGVLLVITLGLEGDWTWFV